HRRRAPHARHGRRRNDRRRRTRRGRSARPMIDARRLLLDSFDAAVAAADPLHVVPPTLPVPDEIARFARTRVVGAGKAAASMAMAVERHWPAEAPLDGLVVTRYAHGLPCRRIEVVEAGHPVPDEAGEHAAHRMLALVGEL